jgi:hypothetical protein
MSETINRTKTLRRISIFFMLLILLTQIVTIIMMRTGSGGHELEEVHEICGFLLFGLLIVHAILFRKSLKSLFS